jgi:ABC-type transport system substrate-binding protein
MNDKNMVFKIVPRELAANPPMLATTLIGTSFRMVDKVQPSVTQEWRRHEEYWGGKPFIERWHYPLITEAANAYAQFIARNIITYSPSARDALRLRRDAPEAIMAAGALGYHSVTRSNFGKIEKDTVAWRDPRVRIAIHKVVNWDGFLEVNSNRAEFAAAGIEIETGYMTHAPFNSGFFLDPRKNELGDASKNYFYDVAEAKKLVEAAGYPDGFELEYLSTSRSPDIVQVQTDEIKKSGFITVKVTNVPLQFYNDNVQVGAQFRGVQFPAGGGGPDYDFLLSRQYHSSSATTTYGDPKMDALIEAQRKALDPADRNAILKDWARLAAQTFPMLPGNHTFGAWTFDWGWLHNVNYANSNDGASHLHWLSADMPKRSG